MKYLNTLTRKDKHGHIYHYASKIETWREYIKILIVSLCSLCKYFLGISAIFWIYHMSYVYKVVHQNKVILTEKNIFEDIF